MGVDALGSLNLLAQEYDLTHQLIVPFAQTSVVLVQLLLLLLQLYRIVAGASDWRSEGVDDARFAAACLGEPRFKITDLIIFVLHLPRVELC